MGKAKAAKKVVDAVLDIAQEARLARAREMGFDTDTVWYHGTGASDVDGFKENSFFTRNPKEAEWYLERAMGLGEAGTMYPVHLKNPQRLFDIDRADDYAWLHDRYPDVAEDMKSMDGRWDYTEQYVTPSYDQGRSLRQDMMDEGYTGMLVREDDKFPGDELERSALVFDPSNIRSVNATFDPDKADSANILAGSAAAAVGLGALAPEEAEAGIAGVAAKSADSLMWHLARHMRDTGATRDEIWKQTGWYQGLDDKWRFEFDDSRASMDMLDDLPIAAQEPRGAISDVLEHDELYQAYPDIGSIRATQTQSKGGGYLANDGFNERIEYGSDDSALHEIQHAIQEREGFAEGGNPTEFFGDYAADVRIAEGEIQAINQELREIAERRDVLAKQRPGLYGTDEYDAVVQEFDALGARYNDLMGQRSRYVDAAQVDPMAAAMGDYRRLAGEAEARNVQKRMNMTPEERRATPPWETLDVPESEQIVRMRGMADPAALALTAATTAAVTDFQQRRQAKQAYWQGMKRQLLENVSRAANFTFDTIELPMRGYHGLTATAGSLAAGNDLETALLRGANVAGQPIETTARELGDAVFEATGSPTAATGVYTGAVMADIF